MLELDASAAELVALEASAFARALPDAGARARYERLAECASGGSVPSELMAALETMLELLFDTGRVSNRAVLQAVFARTPRGQAQAVALREVNRALETLNGQTLGQVRFASGGPSRQTLTIETDRCRVSVEIDRSGARVTALETG